MIKIIETSWEWSGSLSQRPATDYIVLHHAECSRCTAAQVDSWHKANGWAGIGYHFFVRKNGEIYRGRPLWAVGAHVSGMNSRSVGICAEGAYMTEIMPAAQKRAVAELIDYLKTNYYTSAKIAGHGEVGSSDCPGKNFPLEELKDYKNILESEEELSMTRYEELKARTDALSERLDSLERQNGLLTNAVENVFVYNYNDENVPEWARDALSAAMQSGAVRGGENGELRLSHKDLRAIVREYRCGMYD